MTTHDHNHIPNLVVGFGVTVAMASNIYAVRDDGRLGLAIAGLVTAAAAITFDLARRNARDLEGTRRAASLTVGGLIAVGLFAISFGHGRANADEAGYVGWETVVIAIAPDAIVVYGLSSRTRRPDPVVAAAVRPQADTPAPTPVPVPVRPVLVPSTSPEDNAARMLNNGATKTAVINMLLDAGLDDNTRIAAAATSTEATVRKTRSTRNKEAAA